MMKYGIKAKRKWVIMNKKEQLLTRIILERGELQSMGLQRVGHD